MLASHDSYTYQKARNPFVQLIKSFWRTQKKTIEEQYALGVRIFDVRVSSFKKDGHIQWRTAHGLAKFNRTFNSLESICSYFEYTFPNSIIRIYLEDNKPSDEVLTEYLRQASIISEVHANMIWEIGTHYPWKPYFTNKEFQIKEYYCHLFNWNPDKSVWYNLKHFDWSSRSLPAYSKKHNPEITKEMIDDPNVLHFMDYIGVY